MAYCTISEWKKYAIFDFRYAVSEFVYAVSDFRYAVSDVNTVSEFGYGNSHGAKSLREILVGLPDTVATLPKRITTEHSSVFVYCLELHSTPFVDIRLPINNLDHIGKFK